MLLRELLLRTIGLALDLSEWRVGLSSSAVVNMKKPYNEDEGHGRVGTFLRNKFLIGHNELQGQSKVWLISETMTLNQSCPRETQCEPQVFFRF